MGGVCIYFNMLVKSPLFIKFMVQINERTKIDISLNTFETEQHKGVGSIYRHGSKPMHQQSLQPDSARLKLTNSGSNINSPAVSRRGREDKDAELEILKNVKIFLTASVKKNEEVIVAL